MRRRICFVTLMLLAAACQVEQPGPVVFGIAEPEPWTAGTRSLLTASDIETRKTCVTLAAYADGSLAAAGHYAAGLEAMSLDLEPDRNYTVYALVNMGDMTQTIPLSESGLSNLTYRIPSYTEGAGALASSGLPMAGKLAWPGQGNAIPVKRLLAKVTAHLSCDWDGAVIREVRVRNLNRTLRPFGDAVREEDWDQQEFHGGTGASSGTFTFYVPENRQGTIDGIKVSGDKSPDRNATVRSREEDLTYLETSVTSSASALAGDITYRSYLGGNATDDFDIRRNGHYDWTVTYHVDRTQDQDWKRDGDVFRLDVTADRTEAYVGETVSLTALCHRSDHGTRTDTDVTQDAVWTRVNGGSTDLRISQGNVTAEAPGEASFHAAYTLDGNTAWANSPVITFRELPPLSISWFFKAVYVGQRGTLYIEDLLDGATITEVTSSDESVARKATINDGTVYVNLVGAKGSATLTVKASNGQTGTFTVSPLAPCLLDVNSYPGGIDYYGHPDGTDINKHPSGHGGARPGFEYFTGNSAALANLMTVGTDASPTTTYTGKKLAPDLYDSLLKPMLTVSDPMRFGMAEPDRIWVKDLTGYPSEGGVEIGTLTASSISDCGVKPFTDIIYSVDPFAGMTSTITWPDFQDKGMLADYTDCEDYHKSIQFPGSAAVNASATSVGWDIRLAGTPNETFRKRFSASGNSLSFDYTEGDDLPHIGGLCEVLRTVTNPYSGQRIGKTFLTFKVIVWGAFGGSVAIITNSLFEVRPAYIGPEAAKPTGSVFSTTYAHGETVDIYGPSGNRLLNGTVSRDDVPHRIGQTVYSVTLSDGDVKYNAQVYRSIHPSLTCTYTPGPYYRIVNLEDIQTKIFHPDYHPGWVVEPDGNTP